MTEYVCDQQICNNATLISSLLRGDLDDSINSVSSVLKSLADATQKPAKKWITTKLYRAGEIVSFGSKIYIAKVDNIAFNPQNYRQKWYLYQLPYTQNQSKIKAYVIFKTNLSILKSYNIASITELSDSRYRITPTVAADPAPVVVQGLVESNLDQNFILSIDTYSSSTYIDCDIKTIQSDQKGYVDNVTDDNLKYVTLIWYSTGINLA